MWQSRGNLFAASENNKKGQYYIKKRLYQTKNNLACNDWFCFDTLPCPCLYLQFFCLLRKMTVTLNNVCNGQYQKISQCTCGDASSTPTFPLTITLLRVLKQFNPWPLQRLKLADEQGQSTQKVKRSAYFDLDTTKCAYFAAQGEKPCWGFELAGKLLLYLKP